MQIEINNKRFEDTGSPELKKMGVMITPEINEDFWILRVKLHKDQSIVGFPKFGTIGIGFAQEIDWNTNLPYTCTTQEIFNHIKRNKIYPEISDSDCVKAISMIQETIRTNKQLFKVR